MEYMMSYQRNILIWLDGMCLIIAKKQNLFFIVAGYHENKVTLDANVMELQAQTQHAIEIDYNDDDCNQEDDTIIDYINDHEENEGNNSTNDDEVDSTFDGDDICL
ncbi:hypothetical protein H5410_040923 [Solanum commersonii]|uniref:Uncharacterized protein n=1 Tax=Solanum commersonii TaxID=4109 RepID=A0A9J5XQC6_SOLCO|nr:hypothetical protein H5410_040923 [Solanum commersonii]